MTKTKKTKYENKENKKMKKDKVKITIEVSKTNYERLKKYYDIFNQTPEEYFNEFAKKEIQSFRSDYERKYEYWFKRMRLYDKQFHQLDPKKIYKIKAKMRRFDPQGGRVMILLRSVKVNGKSKRGSVWVEFPEEYEYETLFNNEVEFEAKVYKFKENKVDRVLLKPIGDVRLTECWEKSKKVKIVKIIK